MKAFLSLTVIALFGLSACGGGGSNTPNNSTTPDTSNGSTTTENTSNGSTTTSTTLASPSGVTLTKDFNARTITISWQAVSGATSYTVYSAQESASALGENGFTNHSTLNGHAMQADVTGTEHTLSNLTQGKTYYVFVQAVNDSTKSAYKASDEKSIKLSHFEKLANYEGKCVIDRKNNKMWEVKQDGGIDDKKLRDKRHTYSWYDTNINNNEGNAGMRNEGTCYNKKTSSNPNGNECDTTGFVNSVNAEQLCGFADWRMPTEEELLSLVDEERKMANEKPVIDISFFPNTSSAVYISSTSSSNPLGAMAVDFSSGIKSDTAKEFDYRVRLVRPIQ